MFVAIERSAAVASAQKALETTIKRRFKTPARRTIGYPGGTVKNAQILTDGHYWFHSRELRGVVTPRHLNWFGIFPDHGPLDISVEINTVYHGHNGRVAGLFGSSLTSGQTFLLHSGRVGGGKKGIGKSGFLEWRNSDTVEVTFEDRSVSSVVAVMPVEGSDAVPSLIRYIDEIAAYKLGAERGINHKIPRLPDLSSFSAEGRGKRTGKRSAVIDYVSRHGEVVDALFEWRATALDEFDEIKNNKLIDLAVCRGTTVTEVYEVKTATDRTSLYTAVGQVLIHGSRDGCKKTIVIPALEPLPSSIESALHRVQIDVIRYRFLHGRVEILA